MNFVRADILVSAVIVVALSFLLPATPANAGPTIKEYMAVAGSAAKFVPVGRLRIKGYRAVCGRRPTVSDPNFDSWGGAYPGFIILNPKALRGLPTAVQLYVYAHECGHQFGGAGESKADRFAIRRGVRRGWLRKNGMKQICAFISKIPGDAAHPPGPLRCKRMTVYYNKLHSRSARSR